jgi:hypothetical protein
VACVVYNFRTENAAKLLTQSVPSVPYLLPPVAVDALAFAPVMVPVMPVNAISEATPLGAAVVAVAAVAGAVAVTVAEAVAVAVAVVAFDAKPVEALELSVPPSGG